MKLNNEKILASFLQTNHIEDAKAELTCKAVLRYCKTQGLELTLANLNFAWQRILETVLAMREPEAPAPTPQQTEDLNRLAAKIERMSSEEFREYLKKSPENAAKSERALALAAAQEPKSPKPQPTQPKTQPKSESTRYETADELKARLARAQ
jgi:hypothetical protein